MQYILKNLKPIACGEDLEASNGEVVFNPEGTHKLAELRAVAKANGIEAGKLKMAELVPLITAAFEAKNLPERINIKAIVLAGIKAGKSDDEIMQEMVNAGVHIRDARGVAIFAKACFGHPSPSKRQKLNATANAFGAPDVLRTCRFATPS